MSDNVGLSTPRGSGTSGYVQRNLAHMRPRDRAAPYPPRGDLDDSLLRHRQRQPDREILEHDRKREVEVKVFELRDQLEDEEVDEDEIDIRCDALRKELLAKMNSGNGGSGGSGSKKSLKPHQVHEMADAKIRESERLRSALRIGRDYEEGGHWKRQEERLKKARERDAVASAATAGAGAGVGDREEYEDEEEGDYEGRGRGRGRGRRDDYD